LDVIFVLAHSGILVFSFPINRTPRVGGEASTQPSTLGFHFARCGCASCLIEERRERKRSLQSSKEWEDIVAVSHLVDS
jgi:hypothetical protein